MIGMIGNLLGGGVIKSAIEGVSGFLQRRQENRHARQIVEAKIALSKAETGGRLELAEHELAVLRTEQAGASWKDEYVTLLVSTPILLGIAGTIASVFDPGLGSRIIAESNALAAIMTGSSIDYAELWLIVVTVSLGVRRLGR